MKDKAEILEKLDEDIFELMIEEASEDDCEKEADETSEVKEKSLMALSHWKAH